MLQGKVTKHPLFTPYETGGRIMGQSFNYRSAHSKTWLAGPVNIVSSLLEAYLDKATRDGNGFSEQPFGNMQPREGKSEPRGKFFWGNRHIQPRILVIFKSAFTLKHPKLNCYSWHSMHSFFPVFITYTNKKYPAFWCKLLHQTGCHTVNCSSLLFRINPMNNCQRPGPLKIASTRSELDRTY